MSILHATEGDLIPYGVSAPSGKKIAVLAPHPDDETFGMGGTLSLLAESGRNIKILILTKGEKADPSWQKASEKYTLKREKETVNALGMLGVKDYEFLRCPDRELQGRFEEVKNSLSNTLSSYKPDTVYTTSPLEPHPDHRASASLALALQPVFGYAVVFYECVAPIRPNLIVDITSVFAKKLKAIEAYKSQLKLKDYKRLITALNVYRTFTLDDNIRYAESFWAVKDPLTLEKLCRWMGYQSRLYDV